MENSLFTVVKAEKGFVLILHSQKNRIPKEFKPTITGIIDFLSRGLNDQRIREEGIDFIQNIEFHYDDNGIYYFPNYRLLSDFLLEKFGEDDFFNVNN